MNTEQAFQLIEEAKVRPLTQAEADELGLWAKHELEATPVTHEDPAPLGSTAPGSARHVLIDFITAFTKQTRPTPHFGVNFRLVNAQVMPHVVKCFEAPKS